MIGSIIVSLLSGLVELFFIVHIICSFAENKRFDNLYVNYVIAAIVVLISIIYDSFISGFSPSNIISIIVLCICITVAEVIISRDSFLNKIIVLMVLLMPQIMIKLLCDLFFYILLGMNEYNAASQSAFYKNYSGMYMVICCISFYAIILLIHNRKQLKRIVIPVILLSVFPLIHIVYISLIFRPDLADNIIYAMLSGLGAIVFNTAVNLLFFKFISVSNKIYEHEKEEELKANLEHLDKKYFEAMDKELNESRLIRQDILKNIGVMKKRLSVGEFSDADQIMGMIDDSVEKLSVSKYCQEPTVDMVLVLKKRKADIDNIPISIKAVVPKSIGISKLDLSSVVSNLVDNAIESANNVKGKGIKPYVNVNIGIRGDYLVIRTENSTLIDKQIDDINNLNTTKDNSFGIHGYGLKILKNIAGRYNGDITVEIKDNICVFVMLMELNDKQNDSIFPAIAEKH